eukprot:Nk52_evm14s226 gene=Nk52_evmTU14s226
MGGSTQENVKVAVRVRPFNEREAGKESKSCISVHGNSLTMVNPFDNGKKKENQFTFDYCYPMETTQDRVYRDLGAPLLRKALEGYNTTIFAYGQTGSGKTYNMTGSSDTPGMIPQMNRELYRHIEETAGSKKFLVTCSYLEIYNERIHDLLNPSDKEMKVRQHPTLGVYVEGLAELVVRSFRDIQRLQEQGNKVRTVGATNMNEQSSRSHSIFTIKIDQKNSSGGEEDSSSLRAHINLVDLAGSERAASTGATGDRLKEGAAINKSLSALGNVINALADPKRSQGHVPYRDSKLTRILQESLGGNTLTVMLAAISPADINYEETLSTLQYANRAKNIQNESHKNEDENAKIIRELREEIARLRGRLGRQSSVPNDGKKGGTEQDIDAQDMEQMEAMIKNLEIAKQQTWEEKEKISTKFEDERRRNLASKGILGWVMDTLRKENKDLHEKLEKLQAEKEGVVVEYKDERKVVDSLKAKLQSKIEEYDALAEGGMVDDEESNRRFKDIHVLKEELKSHNDKLKGIKKKLKDISQKHKQEQEEAAIQNVFLKEDSEVRKLIQNDERKKLEAENAAVLERERQKMRTEMEREKQELSKRKSEGKTYGVDDYMKLEMQLIEERAEKGLLLSKLSVLQKAKERLNKDLDEVHTQYQSEMEIQQLRNFQVFRNYRYFFEEQKRSIMQNYRTILEESIQDALFFASRNQDLEEELFQLKRKLKDKSGKKNIQEID